MSNPLPNSTQLLAALYTVIDYCDYLTAVRWDDPDQQERAAVKTWCGNTIAAIHADRAANVNIGRQLSQMAENVGTSEQAYFELGSLARFLTTQADQQEQAIGEPETDEAPHVCTDDCDPENCPVAHADYYRATAPDSGYTPAVVSAITETIRGGAL